MSLYTAAHYKNQPNDLQMLSDAPAHHLFVLLGPKAMEQGEKGQLPDILVVVQVKEQYAKIPRKAKCSVVASVSACERFFVRSSSRDDGGGGGGSGDLWSDYRGLASIAGIGREFCRR